MLDLILNNHSRYNGDTSYCMPIFPWRRSSSSSYLDMMTMSRGTSGD